MPCHRQVKVEVLGGEDEPLREYGETKNARMRMVSCFIQSETAQSFCIRITPEEKLLRDSESEEDPSTCKSSKVSFIVDIC